MNNNIKKITTGAVLLAIVAVLMLIDMWTSYFLTDIVILAIPIVIIMYSCMYKIGDGLILCIGIVVMGVLFGNMLTYAYLPLCIIVGIGYALMVKKNFDCRTILLLTIVIFIVGEVLLSFVFFPLLGLSNPVDEVAAMASQFTEMIDKANSISGTNVSMEDLFSNYNGSLTSIFTIVYVVSTILLGVLDGVLTHLLSMLLLKRFKVVDLGRISLYDMKPNPVFSYIAIVFVIGAYLSGNVANEKLSLLLLALGLVGAMFLMYEGFVFMILYGKLVWHKTGLTIVLCIAMMFLLPLGLVIIGFLYGSGPLRKTLERKVEGA